MWKNSPQGLIWEVNKPIPRKRKIIGDTGELFEELQSPEATSGTYQVKKIAIEPGATAPGAINAADQRDKTFFDKIQNSPGQLSKRQRIYAFIDKTGPCTQRVMSEELNIPRHILSGRIREMVEAGELMSVDKVFDHESGTDVTVYDILRAEVI